MVRGFYQTEDGGGGLIEVPGIQKSASETGSAATQLLGATQELTKQNELLAGQVNEFLAGIRAE
jgi:methyl-accepting chemotaxis protein